MAFSDLTSIPISALPTRADVAEKVIPHGERQPERQRRGPTPHGESSGERNQHEPLAFPEQQETGAADQTNDADNEVALQGAIAGHEHSLPDPRAMQGEGPLGSSVRVRY